MTLRARVAAMLTVIGLGLGACEQSTMEQPAVEQPEKARPQEPSPEQQLATKLPITGASIERQKSDPFLGDWAYIEFSVTNSLPSAVAKLKLRARMVSPGRSVPWGSTELSEDVSGGIEPGETRRLRVRWSAAAAMLGSGRLFTAETPADAQIEIAVIGAIGADGKPLH